MNSVLPFARDELWKRNALRVTLLFLGTAILVTPFYFYLAIQTGAWQLFTLAGGVVMLVVASAVSVILVRREQTTRGIGLLVGAILVLLLIASSLISRLGLAAGLIAVIVTLAIVTQTLAPQNLNKTLLASVIAAVGAGFLDLWAPSFQFVVPGIRSLTLVIAVLLVLVFSIVIARQFPAYHLSTKLIIIFLAFTLVPIGLLALLNNQTSRATLTEDANQKLLAAATQTADDVDTFIEMNLNLVHSEAQLPQFAAYLTLPAGERSGSDAETQVLAALEALKSKDEANIHSYTLLDSEGQATISTFSPATQLHTGTDHSGQSYFQIPLQQNRPYVSPVLANVRWSAPGSSEPALFFSSPVGSTAGNPVGVLLARYDATVLQQIISQSNGLAGADSFAVLFDENLAHLAHGVTPESAFTLITPLEANRIVQLQEEGRLPDRPAGELVMALPLLAENLAAADANPYFTAEDATIEGRLNQVVATGLASQPWLVAFFQPQDVFLSPATRQTQVTILLSVIIAGVVAAGAIGVSQRLTAPIVHLTEVAARVTQGDLTAQARVSTSDESGTLAVTFNTMTAQIRDLINTLEQRVADRTQALATSTEVSRRLSTILDQHQLVAEVVEQVRSAFDYYHVHIYLFDEDDESLVMVGGTGEAGRTMLAAGHKLAKGKGLVGRAGASNTTIFVADVSTEPAWLPNPLLPDTRAEAAVPIAVGKRVLGVLDVQHNVLNGLQQQDVDLLQAIANQVAVALRNAQLFTQVQAQSQELVLINRVVSAVAASMDLQQSMQIIATELAHAVAAEQTGIALLNANGQSLTVVAEHFDETSSASAQGIVIPVEGNTLTQQVLETRQPVIVQDAQHNPLTTPVHDIMRQRHVQTLVILPMIAGDAVIGTVGIDSLKENYVFTADQLRLAETIIFQAAAAVQNARLFEQTQAALAETQRRSRELALINEVVSAVAASLDLRTGLETICSKLAQAVDVGQVRIALLNEDNTKLTIIAEHYDNSKSSSALGFIIPVAGNLLTQQVLETRQPVIVADAQHNPVTAPVHEGMREQGIESLVVLPILAGNEVIGTVGIDILEKGRVLSAEELRLAQTIVFQVATAVQNARLFEQTETALAETDLLYQASAQLNAAQSYDDVLTVLCQYTELGQQSTTAHIAYFDQPWTDSQAPSWIDIIAVWGQSSGGVSMPRYRLSDIPPALIPGRDQPTLVEDVANNPMLDEATRALFQDANDVKSVLFLPLAAGGQWIGYLGFFYYELTTFAEHAVRRLTALASQAAVTVQTIHLLEETHRLLVSEQRQRLITDTLLKAASRLSETLSESELRRITVEQIYDILLPDHVNLFEWMENDHCLRLDIRLPAEPEQAKDKYQQGQFITPEERPDLWQVFSHNSPLLSNSSLLEAQDGEDGLLREHYRLPWFVGTKPMGVIEVFTTTSSTAQRATISEEDQVRCQGVVRQAAIALQNARSYEQEQARARREQVLREIATKVRGSADVDTIMRTAVQEIGQTLGRRTFLYLDSER